MVKIGIYLIKCIITNKIYIGKSFDIIKRMSEYKRKNKNSIGPRIYNSINKYGWDKHEFRIIEECDEDNLLEKEIYWKNYYLNQLSWKNVLFCQLIDGKGGRRSEETINKIRKKLLGKKQSFNTVQKRAQSLKGKSRPKEVCDKISQTLLKNLNRGLKISKSLLGVKKTKQHCLNISKNSKGIIRNNKFINQYDLNNNFIREWISITEAKKFFKGDIRACCIGKQKTAAGFKWEYKK